MESRVRHLEQTLSILGYSNALRAMDWMIQEMCAEKGFVRHSGAHYYYHLIDTTQDIINLNKGIVSEDVITACLLHDAVEDIPGVTARMLESMFNSNVATIVNLVTKKPELDYKIEEVMQNYMAEILKNIGASLVKTADRKHNFSTLLDATPEKQYKQAVETETFFIPFFKECRKIYPRYAHYFFSAKTILEPYCTTMKEKHAMHLQIKRLEERLGVNQ